ncbi:MAG: cytochrome c oxidase subunit II [Deltaproteobacteria bacterium]|nr:cytochrome c oxidase subunit II [Deltaproteobacteria bacterium]
MNGRLADTLPLAASDLATRWDDLYIWLFYVLLVFFFIAIGPMVYFAIKYRAKPGVKSSPAHDHNTPLEILWTAIPTAIVFAIFAWGWIVYKDMVTAPADSIEVRVIAKRWGWTFQYDDGRIFQNQLFVPKDKNVKLIMTSQMDDVLHSFFVPTLRIKQDLVPGMYTYIWFNVKMAGQHQVFCAEYCGTGHSGMLAKLVVLEPEEWQLWKWGKEVPLPPSVGVGSLAELGFKDEQLKNSRTASLSSEVLSDMPLPKLTLADQGRKLMESRGCMSCHSDNGSRLLGPSLHGLFGHETFLSNGRTTLADENYIRRSIEIPQADIVGGYEGVTMPPYAGQLSETEMNALIAYIKSLN